LVYQAGAGGSAKIVARGLGVLPIDRQVEELMDWLAKMAAQVPSAHGGSDDQQDESLNKANAKVLAV